jgi:hypothetical protein
MTLIASQSTKFRDAYEAMVPRWMKGWLEDPETGFKTPKRLWRIGYAVAIHADLLADLAVAAIKCGFPGGYSSTFDRYIGQERGIVRGYEEPAVAYEARMRAWRDTMMRKGDSWCLLEQLQAYFTGHAVAIDLLSNTDAANAIRYRLAADGTRTTDSIAWNWDGAGATLPSRFWVILHVPTDVALPAPTWGDGGWEAVTVVSETIGSTAPYWMVQNVKAIVEAFRADSSKCSHIILVFDDGDWTAQQPDGTWDHMGNRNPNACYWKGTET